MALKRTYATRDEIPQGFAGLYEEQGGKWTLKLSEIEGIEPSERVKEFRENNIAIARERDALQAKLKTLEGLDPEEHKRLKELAAKQEEDEAKKNGKTQELIEQRTQERVKGVVTESEKKVKEAEEKLAAANARMSKIVIEKGIADAAIKSKVLPTAVEDVVTRGKSVFKLEGDQAVAYDAKGQKLYGKDGKELTVEGWLADLTEVAPHLFAASVGSGASGKGGGAAGQLTNPFLPGANFNLTAQGDLYRKNPTLAKELAREAGLQLQ